MNLKHIRNIAFWTFLVLYLVITPLISLHALGFVVDPKTFRFVKTGIISISSEPKEVDIFVNSKLQARKTPVAVTGLLPGLYEVKIEAPKYQNIEMKLNVQAEEVTRMDHLLLIPKELSIQTPVSAPINLMIQPDGSKFLFLFSKEGSNVLVNALDLRKKKLVPILVYDEKRIEKVNAVRVSVSDDEKKALLQFRGEVRDDYWVIGLAGEVETIELSKNISETISNVRFHPKNSKELLCLTGQNLNLLDAGTGSMKKTLLTDVRSFEGVDDTLYFFTSDFRLLSSNLQGREAQDLLPDRGLYKLLFGEDEKNSYRMFLTSKRSAFWLRQDGLLVTNRLPHFIDERVKGVQLVQDSEKLLYWKKNELWVIDLEIVSDREKSFFEKGPVRKLIFTTKHPIVSAQMIRNGYQVLLATTEDLMLLQTDANLTEKSFPLIKHRMKEHISFSIDEVSGELYWADHRKDSEAFQLQKSNLFEGSLFPFSIRFKKPFSSSNEVIL